MPVRGKAIVILRKDDRFLFTVCVEEEYKQVFYIPVGGGIEFGEYSIDAAKREALEETGREVTNLRLLNIKENIFRYNAKDEHEILFTYLADFVDPSSYYDELDAGLDCDGKKIELTWATIEEVASRNVKVYPTTLLEDLAQLATQSIPSVNIDAP